MVDSKLCGIFRGRSHTNANVTGSLIIFHEFPFGSYLVPRSPASFSERRSLNERFRHRWIIKIRMQHAVSMTDAISNNYISFIGLYTRNSFSTGRVSPRARPQAITIERLSEKLSVEKSISPYYADVQLAVPRGGKSRKKGRIDRRNRHVHYALLYGWALLSVRSSSWFPVDWGSFPVFLSRWMYKWTKDCEPRAGRERATEDRDEGIKRDGEGRDTQRQRQMP